MPSLLPHLKLFKASEEGVMALRQQSIKAMIMKEASAVYQAYRVPCSEVLIGEK